MFAHHAAMNLKVDSAPELARLHETEIIPLLSMPQCIRSENPSLAPGRGQAASDCYWKTNEERKHPQALMKVSREDLR